VDLSDPPLPHYKTTVWDSTRWGEFTRRTDDVLICTSYKSGTTWMQMICALLIFRTVDVPAAAGPCGPDRTLRKGVAQPMAAAFTSSSMKGRYCLKLAENISTSLAA